MHAKLYIMALLLLVAFLLPMPVGATEFTDGFVTVINDTGEIILQTGLEVRPGDEYINEDDRLYRIIAVEGLTAKAVYIRNEVSSLRTDAIPIQASTASPGQRIGIYHTHSDESYIPSDGKASLEKGGSILQVGAAFAKRLGELGFQPDQDQTLHYPHDANAYQRSRRTMMKLLEKQPAALFDIHRDSAPANIYNFQVNGQDATKLLIVVGQENQNRQTTMDYAKSIKSAADAKYKGLVRGIFIAAGSYNQDLNPRSILIEIGTQYNNREAAERSAALFADVVPSFLGTGTSVATGEPAGTAAGPQDKSGPVMDIAILLGTLIAGAAVFLFISTGSWREAKKKLSNFRKYEFNDLWGRRNKR